MAILSMSDEERKKISEQHFSKNTDNDHDFTFTILDRK
jgi:hypothetical protein